MRVEMTVKGVRVGVRGGVVRGVDLEDVRVEGGGGGTLLLKVRLEVEDDECVLEMLVLLEDVRELVDDVNMLVKADVEDDDE